MEAGGQPVADAAYRVGCMNTDTVNVTEASAKIQSQWTKGNRSTFFWQWSERYRRSRFAGPLNPLETTNRQRNLGLARPVRFEHQFVASRGFVIQIRASYSNKRYVFAFQNAFLHSEHPIHAPPTCTAPQSSTHHTQHIKTNQRDPTHPHTHPPVA